MEARWLTVGPVQENTWIARQDGSEKAILIDPGDEPETILGALKDLGTTPEAILITHCHFDHVGAVKALAMAVLLFIITQLGILGDDMSIQQGVLLSVMALLIYTPLAYMTDRWVYNKNVARAANKR